MESIITLPRTTRNLADLLSTSIASTRENNGQCLMLVLKSLRYLARQGSALRGDKDEGNLIQLVKLMGNNDPTVCFFFFLILNT